MEDTLRRASDQEPPQWFRDYEKRNRRQQNKQNRRIRRLEVRVNALFAGLAVLLVIANLIGPAVANALHV